MTHRIFLGMSLSLLALTIAACGPVNPNAERKALQVDNRPAVCSANGGPWFCPRTKEKGEDWDSVSGIDGFEPEWGVSYELIVVERPRRMEATHTPDTETIHRRTVSTEKVDPGTTFTIGKRLDARIIGSVDEMSGHFGYDGKQFTCRTESICDELESLADSETYERFGIEYTHQDPVEGPIRIDEVLREDESS